MLVHSLRGTQYFYNLSRNRIGRMVSGAPDVMCTGAATTGMVKLPFDTEMLKSLSEKSISYLSMTITEACNMRCRYCTYSGGFEGHRVHTSRSMTREEGAKILDWLYRHSENSAEVRIGFYGGEVLTNARVLMALTAYAQEKFGDKLKNIFFTTNGTLLDEDVAEWISQNPKLSVSVTLNGPSEIHDRNRVLASGEATQHLIKEKVEALAKRLGDDFHRRISFLANFRDYRERADILSYFETHEMLRDVSVLCTPIDYPPGMPEREERDMAQEADGIFRSENEASAIRKRDSDTFETYAERLVKAGIKPDMLVKYHRRYEGIADNLYFPGGCIPFANRLAVDLKGDLHFCEATDFLFPIGNALRDEIYESALDELQSIEHLLNDGLGCRNCPAVNFCSMCFKDFLSRTGVRKPEEVGVACEDMRRKFMHDISVYVSVLEEYPEFLDSLPAERHGEEIRKFIHAAVMRKGG